MVVIITLIAGEVAGVIGMVIAIPVYVVAKIVISNIYEYFKSMKRHEHILRQELQQTRRQKAHLVGAH